MAKTFRKGAVGALLDEYERALQEFKSVIADIPASLIPVIIDPNTEDDNCRSIQTILTHVVHSGYGYAATIHHSKGHNIQRPPKTPRSTIVEYINDLDDVFRFTETVLNEFTDRELEQHHEAAKMLTNWGQKYDAEQLMEHAIVHILRHRRQIERFKQNEYKLS